MKLFLLSTALLFSLFSCDTATQAPHIAQWKIYDYYSVYSDISIPDHKEEERKMSFYELDLRNDSTFTLKEPNNYNNRKPLVSEGTYTLNDSNLELHTKNLTTSECQGEQCTSTNQLLENSPLKYSMN